jgi:hypothetical protein
MRTRWRNSSPDNVEHRRGFIAVAVLLGRASARLLKRNRPMPSGKWTPTPANTEAVRGVSRPWTREWFRRASVFVVGATPGVSPRRYRGQRSGQSSAGVWRNSRLLMGIDRSESNRKRLSATKGTREVQPSMAIAWIGCACVAESLPTRRLGGGAPVVVRGRESRPHGEGVQNVSFWMTEAFRNREGSR